MPIITLITEPIACEHCMDVFDNNFYEGIITPVHNESIFEYYVWSQNIRVLDPIDFIEGFKLLEIKRNICHDIRVAVIYPHEHGNDKDQRFYCITPEK